MFGVELNDLRRGTEVALLWLLLADGIALSSIELSHEKVKELICRPDADYIPDALIGGPEGADQAGAILPPVQHSLRRVSIHSEVVLLRFHMPLLNLHIVGIGIV